MSHETPNRDRALMGKIIDREIPRRRDIGTITGLMRASGVSRSAIYDAINGVSSVDAGTYRRIEGAGFGWPNGTLDTAGHHDIAGLVDLGAPADLIEWVRRALDPPASGHAESRRQG